MSSDVTVIGHSMLRSLVKFARLAAYSVLASFRFPLRALALFLCHHYYNAFFDEVPFILALFLFLIVYVGYFIYFFVALSKYMRKNIFNFFGIFVSPIVVVYAFHIADNSRLSPLHIHFNAIWPEFISEIKATHADYKEWVLSCDGGGFGSPGYKEAYVYDKSDEIKHSPLASPPSVFEDLGDHFYYFNSYNVTALCGSSEEFVAHERGPIP